MPRYSIEGADRKTGEATTTVIEAPTPEEAEAIANHRGLAVSAVQPLNLAERVGAALNGLLKGAEGAEVVKLPQR